MIENYDEINHFIYNKIEKYNEKFAEFKKNLDLQDQKIKKQCSKNIKKTLKKNPKKLAQNIVNLSQYNIDTTEEIGMYVQKLLGMSAVNRQAQPYMDALSASMGTLALQLINTENTVDDAIAVSEPMKPVHIG